MNKILSTLIIISLILSGGVMWHTNELQKEILHLEAEISETNKVVSETQSEIDTVIGPSVANTGAELTRMKGQIENFNLYVSHERKRRIKIFQVREAIKKTITNNIDSYYFKETKKLSSDDLYRMSGFIVDYCEYYNVPTSLYLALIRQESAFNPKAVSPSGAQGLSQILPSTGRAIAKELKENKYDPFDIEHSVKFGVFYLSKMLDRFSDNPSHALKAYNAGPDAVQRYLSKKIKQLPAETVNYEKQVIEYAKLYANAGIK